MFPNMEQRIQLDSSKSPNGVHADCDIFPGLRTKLFSLCNVDPCPRSNIAQVTMKNNRLIAVKNRIQELLPLMKFANDCHSYNVQVCLSADRTLEKCVFLEVTKPIKIGYELLLWFSDEVLRLIQMAFLTPINIQGQKKYVCHLCTKTFEYPNPLKLHLTLDCSSSFQPIWNRLKRTLITSDLPLNLTKESPQQSSIYDLNQEIIRRRSCDDSISIHELSTSNSPILRPLSEPLRPTNHHSAFQPYSKFNFNNNVRLAQSLIHLPVTPSALPTTAGTSYELSYTHAAQMETLVSNLGKSKQGHLCIYCGKVYSRKYGLKIHIRTHTGFKPLKCKYCLRPFGDPSNLNKHVRLHAEGETPYKCDLCGKVLVRRRDLDRHLKSRHLIDLTSESLVTQTQLLQVNDTN